VVCLAYPSVVNTQRYTRLDPLQEVTIVCSKRRRTEMETRIRTTELVVCVSFFVVLVNLFLVSVVVATFEHSNHFHGQGNNTRRIPSRQICDISKSPFDAVSYDGDKAKLSLSYQQQVEGDHTSILHSALNICDEIVIPQHLTLVTGPFNLTSHQVLTVDGTLKASSSRHRFPLIAPVLGYGWSNDKNCFLPHKSIHKIIVGALRYAPFIGSFHSSNVTIRGTGRIDGSGWEWWDNCTKCHVDNRRQNGHNRNVSTEVIKSILWTNSSYCLPASRPKLVEMQFVSGISIYGGHRKENSAFSSPLTLANSPFWTITPSYSQDIYISNLQILAPGFVGNTDGCNLDSSRNAVIQNLYISNGDDGIALKSGLDGFGLNLAIPTENIWIENVTTSSKGRGGLAIGSEMSGGIRNVTFRNCRLLGERGITIKPSVGRGGYIDGVLFQNIETSRTTLSMGHDGVPLMSNNTFVPLISNIRFENVSRVDLAHGLSDCSKANQSKCFNISSDDGQNSPWNESLPSPRYYTCKTAAKTLFYGTAQLPWPVCIPMDSPVNLRPDYPNWGPTTGVYSSLHACQADCQHNLLLS
jgi:polygalacturonase